MKVWYFLIGYSKSLFHFQAQQYISIIFNNILFKIIFLSRLFVIRTTSLKKYLKICYFLIGYSKSLFHFQAQQYISIIFNNILFKIIFLSRLFVIRINSLKKYLKIFYFLIGYSKSLYHFQAQQYISIIFNKILFKIIFLRWLLIFRIMF